MGYLLLISFIIHAITFVVIRQLKVTIDRSNKDKMMFDQQQKEIEELLAVYLLEIREENEKLLKVIDRSSNQAKDLNKMSEEVNKSQPEPKEAKTTEKYQAYQPIEPEPEEDTVEQSLAAQVLSLHEKGSSPEAIAKQLNRGKREVELFIKFHQNQTE